MRRLAIIAVIAALAASCSDSDDRREFRGIGTVENNDTVKAIHYYQKTLYATDASKVASIEEGARVEFVCRVTAREDEREKQEYDADFSYISGDIRKDIVLYNGGYADAADTGSMRISSSEGFIAQNMHITRDWKRNDFFEVTATYVGADDYDTDFLGLVCDTTNDAPRVDTLDYVVWLRLSRTSAAAAHKYVNKSVSVPINCLRDSTKERIYIDLMRIDAWGDTARHHLVYSYVNWMPEKGQDDVEIGD
ncbi:MAG: hypothetical protein II951_09185 [Bacteroidales bacterium]|jgi:hypothetical protein|nr:hypothetical protein [Bacteroidales bacterium]